MTTLQSALDTISDIIHNDFVSIPITTKQFDRDNSKINRVVVTITPEELFDFMNEYKAYTCKPGFLSTLKCLSDQFNDLVFDHKTWKAKVDAAYAKNELNVSLQITNRIKAACWQSVNAYPNATYFLLDKKLFSIHTMPPTRDGINIMINTVMEK